MSSRSELLIESLSYSLLEQEAFKIGELNPHDEGETIKTSEKNMLLKFGLLSRLGMGPKAVKSMSEDNFKRMSFIHEAERRESFGEDELVIQEEETLSSSSSPKEETSFDSFGRTDNEVRQAYLNRLINMKILKLKPRKRREDIIILDWDDTLLCTSFLKTVGLNNLPEEISESIKTLDEKICILLEAATSLGQTFIITNASVAWVKSTAVTFLPQSYEIIKEKVTVISARARYEEEFPEDTYRWKMETFLDLRTQFGDVAANIVCVGDSRIEVDAARILGDRFEQALVKTVKFKSNPGIEDLIKQISLLNEKFDQIIGSKTNLTIRLEKRKDRN